MTWAAALLLAVLPAPSMAQSASAGGADAVLAQARALARQGLLSEEEAALGALPADADGRQQGHAQFLLGNIAYERGRFDAALSRYERAISLWQGASAPADPQTSYALQVAHDNVAMTRDQLDRRARLADWIGTLRAVLAALLAAVAVGVALLVRHASRESPSA